MSLENLRKDLRNLVSDAKYKEVIEKLKASILEASTHFNTLVGISADYTEYERKSREGLYSVESERLTIAGLRSRLLSTISDLKLKDLRSEPSSLQEDRAKPNLDSRISQLEADLDRLRDTVDQLSKQKAPSQDEENEELQELKDQIQHIWLRLETLENTEISETIPGSSKQQKEEIEPRMIDIQGGKFLMGSEEMDEEERPIHRVSISSFKMGKFPVTQREWEAIMGHNPSEFRDPNRPVESVSWDDCQRFIEALNKKTQKSYRLPTEAEWEFAARGGIRSKAYPYAGSKDLDQVAWYKKNAGNGTRTVGLKEGNELGLLDMSGNVWEWCQDYYGKDYYHTCKNLAQEGEVKDPKGPVEGRERVIRGGSWKSGPSGCHVAYRLYDAPHNRYNVVGLRLAHDI